MKHDDAAVEFGLLQLGEHVRDWRKIRGLTAALLAERAGITRATLRQIETGSGSVRSENLFSVLNVLGLVPEMITTADPLRSDLGRARAGRLARQRVRPTGRLL